MHKLRSAVPKILLRILDVILIAAVLLIISMTVYIMSCNSMGKPAEIFVISAVKIVSGSMEPSIRDGDYIIIEKTETSALEVGDIICYYSSDKEINGRLNTHRIMEILPDGSFITKGDANKYCDETPVTPDSIIGKYRGKLGFLRWLSSFGSADKFIFILIAVILTAVSVFEVKTIAGAARKVKEEQTSEEKERLIREAIEKEKQRLIEEERQAKRQ